jgi:hypothetical protein
MKAIGLLLVLMAVGACTWLVADGDRARLQVWGEHWAAGAIARVDDLLQHGAELRMRIDRMKAEADDLHHYIATLEDNLAYQMEAGRREERYWKRWTEGAASEIDDLRTQLAHQADNDDALMRDLAVAINRPDHHTGSRSGPHARTYRKGSPSRPVFHCLDHIANELNAVEAMHR